MLNKYLKYKLNELYLVQIKSKEKLINQNVIGPDLWFILMENHIVYRREYRKPEFLSQLCC